MLLPAWKATWENSNSMRPPEKCLENTFQRHSFEWLLLRSWTLWLLRTFGSLHNHHNCCNRSTELCFRSLYQATAPSQQQYVHMQWAEGFAPPAPSPGHSMSWMSRNIQVPGNNSFWGKQQWKQIILSAIFCSSLFQTALLASTRMLYLIKQRGFQVAKCYGSS